MKHFLQNEKLFHKFSTPGSFIKTPRRRLLCLFSCVVFSIVFSFSNAQVKLLPNFFSTSIFSSGLSQQKDIFYSRSEYLGEKNNDSKFESGSATCTSVASGAWNDPATWSCGVVPGPADNVIIAGGTTVTIDAGSPAPTCTDIAINMNGSLVFSAGTTLEVAGHWTNNGTFSAGTGTVRFKGAVNTTIGGSSPTAFNNMIVDKGVDVTSALESNGPGAISNTGALSILNGLFKMTTGTFQFGGNSGPTIPSTGGIWIAGPGASLNSGDYTITNNGLIRISNGTANFGTNSGNSAHTQNNGSFEVSGGIVNIAGGLENTASGAPLTGLTSSGVSISGGIINLCTIGNAAGNTGSFDMSLSSSVNISGGTIIFQNPSTAATPVDLFIIPGGAKSITDGVFQFGANAGTYRINTGIPLYNVTVNANSSVQLVPATSTISNITYTYDLSITNLLTLNGSLQLNDQNLILGSGAPAITGNLGANNGIIVTNGTGELRKILTTSFAYLFPVGTSASEYSPVDLNFTAGSYSANTYVGVRAVNSKHPNNTNTNNYLKRYWNINTNVGNPTYTITANYLATDVVGSVANIAAAQYNNTLPWIKQGPLNATLTTTVVNAPSLVSFSGITLAPPTVNIVDAANNDLPSASICNGSSIVLNTTVSGDPTITYLWSPGNETTSSISVSTAGTYTVTITDGNGFTASDDVAVTVNPVISNNTVLSAQSICTGTTPAALTGSTPTGGDGTYAYLWESSTDNTTFGSASGTNNGSNYTPGALTQTTWYRRTVTSDGCSDI